MSSTLRLLVLIVVTALALPCSAQLVAADSDVAKCLVKPEQPLVYPEDAYFQNSSGVVTLELEFKNGGSEPNVNVVAATGHWQLKEAVKEYVRGYRLPCAPAGTVTQLRQEFQFFPNDGRKVSQSELRDPDREREERLLKCVVAPASKLTYPRENDKDQRQGHATRGLHGS